MAYPPGVAAPPGYPPPFDLGALAPPPPPRRRRGLVVALVAGGVALVVLCAVLVPVALRSGKSGSPGAAGTTSASASPSPTPLTPEAYQQALDSVDKALATPIQLISQATTPNRLDSPMDNLSVTLDYQVEALRQITPPAAVVQATRDLISGLGGLAATVRDLSGPDATVCAGSAAMARISQSAAADSLRTTIKDLTTADPAKAYHFGTFLPAKTADSKRRLNNGNMIKKAGGGLGQFKVKNSGSTDAVVTLAPAGSKSATFSVYIRNGETATASGIKDGTYDAYMSSGEDWDSGAKVFTMNCRQQKSNDTFKFSTTGRTYTVWTIELHPATGGNGTSSNVNPGDVPT
jgi:hypothetical protein